MAFYSAYMYVYFWMFVTDFRNVSILRLCQTWFYNLNFHCMGNVCIVSTLSILNLKPKYSCFQDQSHQSLLQSPLSFCPILKRPFSFRYSRLYLLVKCLLKCPSVTATSVVHPLHIQYSMTCFDCKRQKRINKVLSSFTL